MLAIVTDAALTDVLPQYGEEALYALVDADGAAVYVGRSRSVEHRLRAHRYREFWPLVRGVSWHVLPLHEACWPTNQDRETEAIASVVPPYNAVSKSTNRDLARLRAERGWTSPPDCVVERAQYDLDRWIESLLAHQPRPLLPLP